jgi:folate-dependent tRNA-U54 methylase TrmFO/GidA
MNIEELPEELRKAVRCLKNGSLTIQADVMEALEEAEDLKDFEERVYGAMRRLMEEVGDVMREFKHRQLTEKERDRMADVYASGPLTYIPEIDDQLFLLGLLQFYDTTAPILSVEAKNSENFFYAENGTVRTEWYGKPEESKVPDDIMEMNEFREFAADVIDEVTEAIEKEYPDLKPKQEFLDQCSNAAILYGECYYILEEIIEDQLKDMFILKRPPGNKKAGENTEAS